MCWDNVSEEYVDYFILDYVLFVEVEVLIVSVVIEVVFLEDGIKVLIFFDVGVVIIIDVVNCVVIEVGF